MSTTHTLRRAMLAAAVTALTALGCNNKIDPQAALASLGPDAFAEKHDTATVAVAVAQDGTLRAAVQSPEGKPIEGDVTGTATVKTASGESKTVTFAPEAKTGTLVAAGPKLGDGLNEVDWTIVASGKPVSGTIHVPAGGTTELAAAAKADQPAADADADTAKAAGPHGGTIERVGDDRVELVPAKSGEVRAYVLDANNVPVTVTNRRIELGVVAEKPETVVLVPEPNGRFLVGPWHVVGEPTRLTLRERVEGRPARIAVVGWRPGVVVVVGPGAPRAHVVVVDRVQDDDARVVVAKEKEKEEKEKEEKESHGHGNARSQTNPHGAKIKLK